MMPISPAACSDWLVRLGARLDRHVRRQTLGLPGGKTLGYDLFDLAFSLQVGFGHAAEIGDLARLIDRVLRDPLDGIKPLLKDVILPRDEVTFLPAA